MSSTCKSPRHVRELMESSQEMVMSPVWTTTSASIDSTSPMVLLLPSGTEAVNFIWQTRPCTGTALHQAALKGDTLEVEKQLSINPVDCRFLYQTKYKGRPQEGSGEAIHLAASHGHKEVVELLLQRRAQIDASVTRNFQRHYDVLHAAVFHDGRGDGNEGMVQYLLEARAQLTSNLDGSWPLHTAFQIGAMKLLPMLRAAAVRQQLRLEERDSDSGAKPSPLSHGISAGRFSEGQLAQAAAPTWISLNTFIEEEPRCIPAFLRRMGNMGKLNASELAGHVDGAALGRVIREYPQAACDLLDGLTAEPVCENRGLHPLPTRISFAARSKLQLLGNLVNPRRRQLSLYQTDTVWKYDATTYEFPDWHKELNDRSWGKPVLDADINICHVPNLCCIEFFCALLDASNVETLPLFGHPVIRGAIGYVWSSGACQMDLLHGFLCIWALLLLVLDSLVLGQHSCLDALVNQAPAVARSLLQDVPGSDTALLKQSSDCGRWSASSDFIGAKGVVDCTIGLLRIVACMRMGWWRSLLTQDNVSNLVRCVLPILFLYEPGNRAVRLIVIVTYWWQLLSMFAFAESIAGALLPIMNLSRGLVPAGCVTLVGFMAFFHAFYSVHLGNKDGSEILFSCFSALFTGQLPEDPGHIDPLQLCLYYASILVFSVFFMNIFIGVIGEKYQAEKARCMWSFQCVRAAKCLTFLTHARVLPSAMCSRRIAYVLVASSMLVALSLQVYDMASGRPLPYTWVILAVLQWFTLHAAYQDKEGCWHSAPDKFTQCRYLWVALPRQSVDPGTPEKWGTNSEFGGSNYGARRMLDAWPEP